MTLLQVSDLEAGYETGRVLFGIDLEIEAGETVSLLGRNGAGKTTTMRSIVGAEMPTVFHGSIRFRGEELLERKSHEIAGMGLSYVPEARRCFPRLTVEENIHVAATAADDPLPEAEMYDVFPDLADIRDRAAKNLSGGQQQMLAIARALVANPDLMLLDEPCEGLAPLIVREVESAIQRINENRDVTVLIVEQNVAAAMAIADRHYIIEEGHIVDEVTTEKLRADEELQQEYLGV
ncbi:ABC transporter ATP-binding protein [Natrarchaeobaculum aegyptiacum]|uniref:ABC transporter ATP-binding protein n=1 Tax=Natrarchaeobaculum aegyptiacum TaxID=745377 RepID=A0A2Z2HQW9_9EURY|nr:ABC transporter ATP-binding protein [Natrarchaeobaculum aegyptiacum]ARS89541.1 ABC transporter ATP-binding protein [Natrarchaeobaculum aegyptiacum]